MPRRHSTSRRRGRSRTGTSFAKASRSDGRGRPPQFLECPRSPPDANGRGGSLRPRTTMNVLAKQDPAIWKTIEDEARRQQEGLEMIASENYTSPAVMAAQGSVLTNKYAEGYPGRRYYGGCEYVDVVERLAIERALKLFGGERANVQPHSGAQANMAVFL